MTFQLGLRLTPFACHLELREKIHSTFFSRFYVYNHVLSKLEQYFPFAELYKLMQIHPAAVTWSQVLPLPNQCEARFLVPVDRVPGSAIFPIHEFALEQLIEKCNICKIGQLCLLIKSRKILFCQSKNVYKHFHSS